jgi:hypothetical protein
VRVAQHGLRAARLGPCGFTLRMSGVELRLSCLSSARNFIHLLGAHALLRLELLVARKCAGSEAGIGADGGFLVLCGRDTGLCLRDGLAQRGVIEDHQRLPGSDRVAFAHQHLLDSAHHLCRDDCGVFRVDGSSGAQSGGNLLLPALHDACSNRFNRGRLCGLVSTATGNQSRRRGKDTTRDKHFHCSSSTASGVSTPSANSSCA